MTPELKEFEDAEAGDRLGFRAPIVALLVYLAAVAVATYPSVLTLGSTLPDQFDSYQHLWILRWYKTCLLEARSPLHCPEIQYPVGAPLGNFSSLHLQAVLYALLSSAISSDVICYNIIWTLCLTTTGLGTSFLIWHVLRDRACALFGGLLAMLSAPMMIHSHGHLELITVGTFPVFLVAWTRFVDAPSRGRLVAAALGYVLVAMSAAYYLVFAIFPAALYVACRAAGAVRRRDRAWLRSRAAWLSGFVAMAMPFLLVLFSGQLWALARGYNLERSREEFDLYGAPIWSYVVPTTGHWLGRFLPSDPYAPLGYTAGERITYVGAVTALLVLYAAVRRVRFRGAGYWWSACLLLVALSLGSTWKVGSRVVSLPSAWAWRYFPVYRMTRVPARFGLFVGVLAAVLAAAGLRHLLGGIPRRGVRAIVYGALFAAAVVDLSAVPYWRAGLFATPACYDFLRKRDPGASICEVPQLGSGGSQLNAACTYWQALHRLRTTSGYSGHPNSFYDDLIGFNSPFFAPKLADPNFLKDPSAKDTFDIASRVDVKDYVWLYLTVNRLDYVVVHQWAGSSPEFPVQLDRIKALLQEAKVFEDATTAVYQRSLLRPPTHPVLVSLDTWFGRGGWRNRWSCVTPKSGRLALYNPDPDRILIFALDAESYRTPRDVRLLAGNQELARWRFDPGAYQFRVSPPFRLPRGYQELTVESDGEERPSRRDAIASGLKKPFSLRVAGVSVDAPEPIAARDPRPPVPGTATR